MSGASNCPETPRQRMIGMMYLVLTAMLALNVSSEILNGFSMVDNSLHTTIQSSQMRNKELYQDFEDLNKNNPAKVKEWLDKAKIVKVKSDELFNYIEGFKKAVIRLTDKENANDSAYVRQIKAKDNLDKAGEYAIVKKNGDVLKTKIEAYRDFLVSMSDNPQKQNAYKTIFSTGKSFSGKPWMSSMFEMMPVAAVVTILTKYQNDIRESEAEIVQYLKGRTDAKDIRVNKMDAVVVSNTGYVMRGGKYSAQIVLSARDTTQFPDIYVGGAKLGKNGMYEVNCSSAGLKTYRGEIKLIGNNGDIITKSFKGEYIVGEPSATISNVDLNVIYRGIPNNFNISVPGVAADNVTVRAVGATLTKVTGGGYVVRTNQANDVSIEVYAKVAGKDLRMGGGLFRVKQIPDPKPFLQYTEGGGAIQQKKGGNMSMSALSSSNLIASYGKDELIKANFRVTQFTMMARGIPSVNVKGSPKLSPAFLNKLIKGDMLVISEIKAEGPDGISRDLGTIAIQL